MATVIEFINTGRCSSTYENFFDLLLQSNLFELKDFKTALLSHLQTMFVNEDSLVNLSADCILRTSIRAEVLNFFIDVWLFCH